jgi:hypothetical protein
MVIKVFYGGIYTKDLGYIMKRDLPLKKIL